MPALPPGVNLRDLRQVTARLHAAGASIEEVNAVRKHLSTVSGGGLVRRWHGGWLTAFLLSDVVGDARDVIASGPTSVDPTTFRQAVAVLQRHRLWSNAPASVRRHLLEGLDGRREETLKRLPPEVDNVVIGGPRSALTGASRMAERLGYQVRDVSHLLVGEASNAGRRLARTVRVARDEGTHRRRPLCLLAAGETTVRLGPGAGRGGRAQELVLAAFAALGGDLHDIVVLAGGTDGEDGPTDAAGAFADERLAGQARLQRRLPGPFLASHDSYRFFDSLGGLLRTGRTGTNVTDLVVVLVG
jgi:glycerate-2-kinase